MMEPFFPLDAQRVVPFVKIDDNDDLTCVRARKTEPEEIGFRVLVIRIAVASLLKLTMVRIDPTKSKG